MNKSSILSEAELSKLEFTQSTARCGKCENNCSLTISKFSNGKIFISGNKCEKGNPSSASQARPLPGAGGGNIDGEGGEDSWAPINLFEKKSKRLFRYKPLPEGEAPRGTIGIPRVLNMYENYPFWFTYFTELGYNVVLSPPTTKTIYESAMTTISSDTVCYPAKVAHGHIRWLLDEGVKRIFYPALNYEVAEDEDAENHYNCPVVATYPEVIRANMGEQIAAAGAELISPFLPYDNRGRLAKKLAKILGVPLGESRAAVRLAAEEDLRFKSDVRRMGEDAVAALARRRPAEKMPTGDKLFTLLKIDEGEGLGAARIRLRSLKAALKASDASGLGIVLAGRPYHLDPEINHGIDKLIVSLGFSVLTEDSVAHLARGGRELRILDQWMYHSRLYRAADFVRRSPGLELVQLNSFGCGPDAITADQVKEILKSGAGDVYKFKRKLFTKKMRETHTILIPQMSPFHFEILEALLSFSGYKVILLPDVDKHAVEEGLRYVNNDACYPTIVALGQTLSYLKNADVDLSKTAIFMSQTGGGCRASNYVALLRKALAEMGQPEIPVVSFNMAGLEKNPGFGLTLRFLRHAVMAMLIGDIFMQCYHRVKPYELRHGETDRVYRLHQKIVCNQVGKMSTRQFKKTIREIVHDFEAIPISHDRKPRVGVVGEILVKYHPTANNDIVRVIEHENGEAVVPGIIDFFLYGMYSKGFNFRELSGTLTTSLVNKAAIVFIEHYRNMMRRALAGSERFEAPKRISDIAKKAEKILSLGNQCGEGWLLTGEMLELIDENVLNIVCLQPFACLPNHITGKGMLKALREYNPGANIVPIDYDPGASEVNQINRIKLMMANAK